MAISIRNPKVELLARQISRQKGGTMTDIIVEALEHRLSAQEQNRTSQLAALEELAAECSALPNLDTRSPEEILGYGENGAFIDGNR